MSKYNNLKKLYSDIEILESAGLYKAASVLHKKFVKEAQGDSLNQEMQPDITKNLQIKSLEDNKNIFENNIENIIYKNYFVQDSVDAAAKALRDIRTLESSAYPEVQSRAKQLVGIFEPRYYDIVMKYQGKPNPKATNLPENTSMSSEPIQALGSGEDAEKELYMRALSEIIENFKSKIPELISQGEKTYEEAFSQIKNEKRKKFFANQVQRLRNQYNTQRFKDQRVNQNVADNSSPVPTQTTQPNVNKPNVATSTDTNNQLYQIVSNFYRSRDVTVTSPEQMYADLKADPARKTVVRNHIRTSRNPNTNQLVALFDSKTK